MLQRDFILGNHAVIICTPKAIFTFIISLISLSKFFITFALALQRSKVNKIQLMYKTIFNKRSSFKFTQFSNKGYSLFSCLGKVVIVGTLSVASLTNARANSISTDVAKIDTSFYKNGKEVVLDEVNVTGSRAPLTRSQQTRMVTVLSREDIQAAPVQSVNDLLKYAVGVDVRQRGPIGAQTDISLRGGNDEQITILLNGINICDPQTGHNAFDFPVDINEIERIEILEGPAARVYGTSSLLGAINIVTRTPSTSSFSSHVESGSYGYASAGARANIAKGNWNNSFSANYTRSDGYTHSKNGNLNTDFDGLKAFYQGNYNDNDIVVKWHAGMSTKGFGSNTFYSAYSDEQYERILKTYTAIQAENRYGKIHMHPSIYWNRNMDKWELFRDNADAYPFNYHRTDVYGVNLNGYFDWIAGRTAIGAELRNEDIVSTNLGEILSEPRHIHGTDVDYTHGLSRTNIQFVLEHNILLKRFTLSAGLVAVKNSWAEMNMKVYPSIDASYNITDNWKVYASYNTSLRMPSFTDLYYNSKGYNANKELKPEELAATEIGVKYHSQTVNASVSGYHNHMKNLIDWIVDKNAETQTLTTTNFGVINSVGVEANIDFDLLKLITGQRIFKKLNIAYAYAHQDQKKYEGIVSQYVLEYLRNKFVANLQMNIWKQLNLGINYRLQNRNGSYVVSQNPTTKEYTYAKYATYGIVDARLSWDMSKYSLYINGNNLFSKGYRDFGRLKQPGCWIMAGASINMNI